jgi:two-component system, chemotaxis family, CheB/CheR fusion protein
VSEREEIAFKRSDGIHVYDVSIAPLFEAEGAVIGLTSASYDVTERLRVEAALRAANAQLLESDRQKDEFLAVLAHELRNPLAPIQSGMDLLRLSANATPPQELLGMMNRQVTDLKRLVNDSLDISRITHRQIALQTEPVDLNEAVGRALSACHGGLSNDTPQFSRALSPTADGSRRPGSAAPGYMQCPPCWINSGLMWC